MNLSGDKSQNKLEILAITLLVIFFSLTGTAVNFGYAKLNGLNLANLADSITTLSPELGRRLFRHIAAIHQIFSFLLPSCFFWFILKRNKVIDYFHLRQGPLPKVLIFSFLLLFLSFPLVNLSAWFNQLFSLPDWASNVEADTAAMISTVLAVNSPIEWLLNLLVIAAIPAVGEELFFRGIVQTKLVGYFNNPHLAIWLGATFFSVYHLQFEGLFPRILLGAVLGYLYYWSINLWIPIILHFFNNALIVSAPYFGASDAMISPEPTMSTGMIIAAAGALFVGYFLIKNRALFLEYPSEL